MITFIITKIQRSGKMSLILTEDLIGFVGRILTITHDGKVAAALRAPVTKKCKAVEEIMGGVKFTFEDGSCYEIDPYLLYDDTVCGDASPSGEVTVRKLVDIFAFFGKINFVNS
jgi:hypothetical protein